MRARLPLRTSCPLGRRSLLWLAGALLLTGLALAQPATDRGFQVLAAATRLVDGVYRLDARIRYRLSEPARQALRNGVALTIELEMEVRRPRRWLWPKTVARLHQRYRLAYHELARQYMITDLNSGLVRAFPTLTQALRHLGRLRGFPLLDYSLLETGPVYQARLRARLDLDALPTPLRLMGYFSAQWRLASPWYEWPL